MTNNRRRFSRIPFESQAHLQLPDGEISVTLIDISLKGALIHLAPEIFVAIGSNARLEIPLTPSESTIVMEVTLVHRQGLDLGLACREIDLDSITHLRRLVELNVGDESILDREMTALVASDR